MSLPVYGPPTASREAIVAHITDPAAHPAARPDDAIVDAPTAAAIWDVVGEAGVDPAFVAGMFHVKSQCGRLGRARTTRSVGNIRWRDVYAGRGYVDVDGFTGYPSWVDGAHHVVDHLRGLDGTDFYAGRRDVLSVIEQWAPADPPTYTASVERIMRELAPAPSGPRVLLIPGHVNIEHLTADGLRSWRDVATLRRGTGAAGERELNADVASRAQRALLPRGVDTFVTDAMYDPNIYGERWDYCIAIHAHRDPGQHGRVAIPDEVDPPFITAAARDRSAAWAQLFVQLWPQLTGIAVDPADQGTINMTQLYTWDYVPEDSAAVIVEMLHLDDDQVDPARLASALATITARALGIADQPPPPPPPPDDRAAFLRDIDELAARAGSVAQRAHAILERG